MIEGESGNPLRVNAGVDLTTATNIKIKLKGEGKTLCKTIADGVSIPGVDYIGVDETFLAGEYILYTFKPGDISVGGQWRAYLSFTDVSGADRVGDTAIFEVESKCF